MKCYMKDVILVVTRIQFWNPSVCLAPPFVSHPYISLHNHPLRIHRAFILICVRTLFLLLNAHIRHGARLFSIPLRALLDFSHEHQLHVHYYICVHIFIRCICFCIKSNRSIHIQSIVYSYTSSLCIVTSLNAPTVSFSYDDVRRATLPAVAMVDAITCHLSLLVTFSILVHSSPLMCRVLYRP